MDLQNKNAIFNIAGPIILNGISFFTIPLFTRLLGPEQYGMVSVYQTWVGIFAIIMGLQVQGSIGTAMARLESGRIKEYISSILILGLIFSALFSTIALIYRDHISQYLMLNVNEFIIMIIHAIASFVVAFGGIAFVFLKQANHNFFVNIILSLSTVLCSLGFILGVYPENLSYLGRIYGMAVPNILCGVGIAFYFIRYGHFRFDFSFVKFCIPICLPLIFHGLSHVVLAQSDRVMLQQMIGNEVTGIYSFMMVFSSILVAIWGALNNTWVPFYYDDLRMGDLDKIRKKSQNYIFIYTIILIVFLMWAPEVIKILAPPTFWAGIELLPAFALGNYFIFLYGFPVNFQFFHKTTYTIAVGTVAAAIFNVGFNFYMIPVLGALGAVIATLFSHILLFLFHEFISERILPYSYHYNFRFFLPGLLVVILSLVVFYILRDIAIGRWLIGASLVVVFCRDIYIRKTIF